MKSLQVCSQGTILMIGLHVQQTKMRMGVVERYGPHVLLGHHHGLYEGHDLLGCYFGGWKKNEL